MRRAALILATLAAGLIGSVATASAGEHIAYCDNNHILKRVVKQFRHQVTHVPNLPDVDIVYFHNIEERRFEPQAENSPIARRYCGASAELSTGERRPIWYLIEKGMDLIGTGYGVEFCVSGFDRWYVYNGHCRVLQ